MQHTSQTAHPPPWRLNQGLELLESSSLSLMGLEENAIPVAISKMARAHAGFTIANAWLSQCNAILSSIYLLQCCVAYETPLRMAQSFFMVGEL